MSGIGLEHLNMPVAKHDPARVLKRKKPSNRRDRRLKAAQDRTALKRTRKCNHTHFETLVEAALEDDKRIKSLKAELDTTAITDDEKIAVLKSLIKKLSKPDHTRDPWPTLASKVYMRTPRRKISGALASLLDQPKWRDESYFCIIPKHWPIPAGELHLIDPKMLLDSFRSVLNRQGAAEADGWLFIGLDGDFDDRTGMWILHMHGVAAGMMIDVIDRVRKLPWYRPYRGALEPEEAEDSGAKQKIRRTQKPAYDKLRLLTYITKSFWTRNDTYIDANRKVQREPQKNRLPNAQQNELLLWMDRWSINDLTLLMGLRVTCSGLTVSNKKTNTNGVVK